jgi:hypothetical protein
MDGVTVPVHFLFRLARLPLLRGPASRAISWLGAKALAAPAAGLRESLPVLPEASKDLERRYLVLGNALGELAGIAGELADASRRAMKPAKRISNARWQCWLRRPSF